MSNLTPQEESLANVVLAVSKQRESEQSDDWKTLEQAARRGRTIKELVALVVTVVVMVSIGTTFVSELKDKPTLEEVEVIVAPIQVRADINTKDIAEIETDLGDMSEVVGRVQKIQDYQLEQSAWQGDVLDHLAQKKRGKPKAKPESLTDKERSLIKND